MNLSMSLRRTARYLPHHPAISFDGATLSYGLLEESVGRIAAGLVKRHALARGARVGLAMENCGEYLPVLYGIWRAGLVAVPMNAKLHAKEIAFILSNSECRACFATPEMADKLTALGGAEGPLPTLIVIGSRDYAALTQAEPIVGVESAPEDEAWLFYTSGTTGRPKGAVLTHRNLQFMAHCYYADFERRQNVTLFAAPTMVTRLINHPRAGSADTRGLKTLYFGGAPMYVSDLETALDVFGPKLIQLYGQVETPNTITLMPKALLGQKDHPRRQEVLESCGIPRTGVEMKVVGEDGRELPAGEIGEVITRSDCVMRGYWNNPEANAKSLRNGWLWTGDLGSVDEQGFLTLKDRSKDMIISGGSNIYPREIEEVLLKHRGVVEAAVVGRSHPEWGEEVVAFVVAKPGELVDQRALEQLCLDNIARFKRPRLYRFVETLPKNNYGKILKTELRQALKEDTGHA